jgi:hypothetical protein
MIAEALVIFACTRNVGCTETSNQYFRENPDIKNIVDTEEHKIRDFIGPDFVDRFGPILFIASGGSGTIKLNKYFSLQGNQSSGTVSYRLDF